jgi:trans-aconitate methyltransferase
MSQPTETYHDYVIKNGQFIGQFEEMYRRFDDPWHQSKQPNPYSRMAAALHLRRFGVQTVLECGCGMGYYTDFLTREVGVDILGIDTSKTAIEKARKLFPAYRFEVGRVQELDRWGTDFDAVLFAEITWYILPDLRQIVELLRTHFAGKLLVHNLVFYKGTQQYGTEYFTNLRELIAWMPFACIAWCEATTESDSTIETSAVFRIG